MGRKYSDAYDLVGVVAPGARFAFWPSTGDNVLGWTAPAAGNQPLFNIYGGKPGVDFDSAARGMQDLVTDYTGNTLNIVCVYMTRTAGGAAMRAVQSNIANVLIGPYNFDGTHCIYNGSFQLTSVKAIIANGYVVHGFCYDRVTNSGMYRHIVGLTGGGNGYNSGQVWPLWRTMCIGGGLGLAANQAIMGVMRSILVDDGPMWSKDQLEQEIMYQARRWGVTDCGFELDAPALPTGLTATPHATLPQIAIAWNNPVPAPQTTGATNTLDYRTTIIYRSLGAVPATAVEIGRSIGTSFVDYNCLPLTTYYYWIKGEDYDGNLTAFVGSVGATTGMGPFPSGPPTGLAATPDTTDYFADLSWTNIADPDLECVRLYRNTTNNSGTAVEIARVAGTTFRDGGLAPSTPYWWWAKSQNTSENLSAFSLVATCTMPDPPAVADPPAPTGLYASAVTP